MQLFLGQPRGRRFFGFVVSVLTVKNSLMTAVRDENAIKMDCSCQHSLCGLNRR